MLVYNKLDKESFQERPFEGWNSISVSASTGAGMSALRQVINKRVEKEIRYSEQDYLISSVRHRDILKRTLERLERAHKGIQEGLSEEFPLLDLHAALNDIGEITGHVDDRRYLSADFSEFLHRKITPECRRILM